MDEIWRGILLRFMCGHVTLFKPMKFIKLRVASITDGTGATIYVV